jgi:signal transduction histidine kinase
VAIETECDPALAALASPELLQEAVAALVENAVAHTREGSIRLTAAGTNGRVAISVTDSGPGILPEFHERIFEPFFRVDEDGKGYGLGLAIAAQAVEAMDGTIEVSGEARGGTTFTVTLGSATRLRS